MTMSQDEGNRAVPGALPVGLTGEDLDLLLDLPLFSDLGRDELSHLIRESRMERQSTGSLLFLHGDPASHFYVVLNGLVKLYRATADGNESVIAILPRGESFAEAAVFEEATYPVSASVVESARLLVIPAYPFLDRMLANKRLALKILASMARRLRQLIHQVEELSLKTTVERLAAYIAGLTEVAEGTVELRLPIEKSLIARHLGMQPETLSRSFARLRAQGVAGDGDRLHIDDIAVLRRLAGGGAGGEPEARPNRRLSPGCAPCAPH